MWFSYLGVLLTAVWLGAFPLIAIGQDNKPTVVPESTPKQQPLTDVKIPLLPWAVRLSDFEGMEPRADLRGKLAEVSGFVRNSPKDGQAATQKTVAYVGYTPTTLYVVFVCFDTDPKLVRAHPGAAGEHSVGRLRLGAVGSVSGSQARSSLCA